MNAKTSRVVFVLWGNYARKKRPLITGEQTHTHAVVVGAHPSPLAAPKGFFGSKPFSKTNAALRDAKLGEIDWQLPDV